MEYPASPTSGKRDPDNEPPFSRIFVVCSKAASEESIVSHFQPFGAIEYCRLLHHRHSGESKGLCFVKYAKASEAARAIELMHNKSLEDDPTPLKARSSALPSC